MTAGLSASRQRFPSRTPVDWDISIAPGGTNICDVTFQAVDGQGNNVAEAIQGNVYLSDSAVGAAVTGTTPSSAPTIPTTGSSPGTLLASKMLIFITSATGAFTLRITDTAKTGFYVAASGLGRTKTSRQLLTADYG